VQVRNEPKDWRKIDKRLPSGAKQNLEPAPEGAWGSTAAAGVSRETLLETGVIAEEEDLDAKRQRAMRFVKLGIVVVVLALGGIAGYSFFLRGKADKYLGRALEMTKGESSKLTPEQAAVVHWAAAEYHARSGKPDAAQRAIDEYGQARAALGKAASLERDAMLLELALDQLDLGGGIMDWSKTVEAVRQTLDQMRAPEARVEAVRQVTRRLADKGQARAAQLLAGKFGADSGELTAVAALELIRSGNQKEGQALADSGALAPAQKGQATKKPPVTPSAVALAVVLGRDEPKPRTSGKKDEERPNADDVDNILVGKAEGLARKGDFAAARALLGTSRPAIRLRSLVVLAGLAMETFPGDQADLNAALDLAAGDAKAQIESPWLMLRLVQLAARALMEDRAVQLAGQISDAGLKAQAQLAIFRARLANMKENVVADEAVAAGVTERTGAAAQARLMLARRNVHLGSGWAKNVEAWTDGDRAAGLAGVALGMMDKRK
jgi:hypothetical protein